MSSIDIRGLDEDDVITEIIFGTARDVTERTDTTHFLCVGHDGMHPDYIFIEAAGSEFVSIRRGDVGNLIKALEKAKEIWK